MQVQPGIIPRYYQLKEILEQRINNGEFQPGDQFLTDDEVCQEYGLSRGTVRRAIDMLVDDGRLRREQGRGTFVTSPPETPVFFRLSSFGEDMRRRGRKPGARLLRLCVTQADEAIARQLQIPRGEDVIEIVRLRLADGAPIAYETRYLPYQTCPQLLNEDLENQSIHSLLIDKFNIPLTRACYSVEARVLTDQEAEMLRVAPGTAGFAVERVTFTVNSSPVSWYQIIYRGDEYRFTAEFQRCLP